MGVIEALQTEEDGTKETNDRLIAVAATHELFTDVISCPRYRSR